MSPRRDRKHEFVLLASREGFGCVMQCPAGCIHLRLNNVTFRFSEPQYRDLLEMLSESVKSVRQTMNPASLECGPAVH